MWLILILVTLTILIVWDYLFKRRRNRVITASRISSSKYTLPLIGDALKTIGYDNKNILGKLESLSFQFGKAYRLWIFHKLFVIVSDRKYFEVILKDHDTIEKPFIYHMLSDAIGDGLLFSDSSKWRARRKMITPTFHFNILNDFVEIFDQQSAVLAKNLYECADGQTVLDIFPKVYLMSLDIIAETAMGVKINAQDHPDLPYVNAYTTAMHIIANRFSTPAQYSKLGFILTALPSYIQQKKSLKILANFTTKIINDRRDALKLYNESTISTDSTCNDVGQKKHMVLLDVLLQAEIDGKPLEYNEIREEVNMFMSAGHDTSASTISFCLYLLARHADIQQKVFEEIVAIIGEDKDKPVTMRDLQELKYLDLVIRESLRLYPTVPIIGRYTERDVQVGDQIIPANTNIMFLFSAATRDPDYFDHPHDFVPERYYSEQSDKTASFAHIPFSTGPRNCIGQKFAMLEIKSTISKLIRHFELLPLGPAVAPTFNVVLHSSTGMNLGLKIRNNK